jgi:RNA polymerase sigma-70 factor (ECF subfamily)
MSAQPSDVRLLQLTHKGNEPAARTLWARFAPRLLAYAASITGDGADDVVQSVFVSILAQHRSTIRRVEDPAAWLLTLTRRAALNYLRSVRRERNRRRERAAQAEQAARRAVPVFVDQEALNAAVASLPRRLREVVVLRHIAGLTFVQTAAALGANRSTTASRYRDAMEHLRMVLGEAAPKDPGTQHSVRRFT